MISILAQERLLGAALGSAFAGIVVFEQRKRIYESISDSQPQVAAKSQRREAILGESFRSEIACLWNRTVDQTLGPVIASLSSRRW
ncbi:uncharacterized protein LOC110806460 [Carica papaya]|uniref:uncharacterized protein LOC110806460 n=1 Tax=Carica papaya TaxID=3649 RepID=UPI000B8C81D2|nr:uncharacterized protein LOC110806460 [Carica papaya]